MTSESFPLVTGKSGFKFKSFCDLSMIWKQDHRILKRNWRGLSGWFLLAAGLGLVFFEVLEFINLHGITEHSYHIIVALAGLLVILGTFLGNFFSHSSQDHPTHIENTREKHHFPITIYNARNTTELAENILTTLATVLPSTQARLFIYHKNQQQFTLAARQAETTPGILDADSILENSRDISSIKMEMCQDCFNNNQCPVQMRSCKFHRGQRTSNNEYCFPLTYSSIPVGLMHIYLPPNSGPFANQRDLFYALAGETGTALGIALGREIHEETIRAQIVKSIQQDLARDLHDTLGQNISFMRMKLEYLSETGFQGRIDPEKEIKTLYGVANDSYDQVRGILAILQSGESGCLENLLSEHAATVAERSGMQIKLSSYGKSQSLPTQKFGQLFFIYREALWNIEKYASASYVNVETIWSDTELRLNIIDDGCGFDPAGAMANHHYGLKFMHERAINLGGTLDIQSTAGKGASLTVQIPISLENQVVSGS
jgi:nitrate/nitrite-specific signal transduction histidine kinase